MPTSNLFEHGVLVFIQHVPGGNHDLKLKATALTVTNFLVAVLNLSVIFHLHAEGIAAIRRVGLNAMKKMHA